MKTPALHPARLALAWAVALAGCAAADAAVINANPSNYRDALANLSPGDTLMLASGTYTQGLPVDSLSGASGQPIRIVGADDQSSVFIARACCNTVQLQGAAYVEIRNLTLDGANIDGPFGVDARGNTHDITLENLRIINHGAGQQTVGISTKGPAWNWIIRRNTIIGAGTGMYLGNSDGTQPFVAGIIENNLIVDTVGYNIEVKHQLPRPTGIGLPTGNARTIIRHNVFSKRNNGSSGDLARPNVLVGHFPLTGTGSGDRYEIYGNFFYENPTEALFQGEGNIALHDNVFVNSSGSAINIQPHNDAPRDVVVYHNTVVASANGIRVSGGAAGYTQRIIGNAAFAATAISGPNQQQNVTGTYASAADELNAPFAAIGSLDLFPRSGRLTGAAIDLSAFAQFTDGTRDFDGRTRAGTFRGAYEGSGTNTGWRLALQIKPATGGAPAPAIALQANPTQVSLQGSSTLNWSATDATSCTASGGWSGSKATSGSEMVGPLAATSAFTLSCSGPGGNASQSVNVTVANGAAAPVVTLQAAPATVAANGTAQLTWNSVNATSCTASGGWSGTKALSGTQSIGPLSATTSFTLACTGDGGSDSATAQVAVASAPTLTFDASVTTVAPGGSATLTWNAPGATGCTAGGAWSGNKAASGSQSTGAINSSSTYSLTCSGAGGETSKQVQIAVEDRGSQAPSGGGSGGGGAFGTSCLLLLGLLHQARRRAALRERSL